MYNLNENSHNYLNTSGGLRQYYRDEPALNNAGAIVNFTGDSHNRKSFFEQKYKQKITGATGANDTKNVEIMLPLKCLSNFWGTLEMPLIFN